jgi:hypothetical protein
MAEAKNLEEAIHRCEETVGKIVSVIGMTQPPGRVETKLQEPVSRLRVILDNHLENLRHLDGVLYHIVSEVQELNAVVVGRKN